MKFPCVSYSTLTCQYVNCYGHLTRLPLQSSFCMRKRWNIVCKNIYVSAAVLDSQLMVGIVSSCTAVAVFVWEKRWKVVCECMCVSLAVLDRRIMVGIVLLRILQKVMTFVVTRLATTRIKSFFKFPTTGFNHGFDSCAWWRMLWAVWRLKRRQGGCMCIDFAT